MIAVGEHGMLRVAGRLWQRETGGRGAGEQVDRQVDDEFGNGLGNEWDGVAGRLRAAMLDGSAAALADVLAEQVCFGSPALPEPSSGRELVAHVLATARAVYQDLTFTEVLGGGERAALFFRARVAGEPLQGCYSLHGDGSGRIVRIDALFRPVGPTQALVAEMMRRLAPDGAGDE